MADEPLKILQTCFSQSWGGLEIHTLRSVSRLHKRGHEVYLACLPESRLAAEAEIMKLKTFKLNIKGYFHPLLVKKLAGFLIKNNISIIHSQLSRDIASVVPAMLLSRRKIPIILSKRMGSYISKKDLFHRLTFKYVSSVLAISEVIRKNVIETTPIKPENVTVLHEPVDIEKFNPSITNRDKIRKECNFTENDFVIGFVGRYSPGKGHEDFLNALSILKTKYPYVKALIVGEASRGEELYEKKIRTLTNDLHLNDTVRFIGFRNDIPDVMHAFDLFAFPSHAEAFGAVLVEAMAMERPVVSTNCDGVLDIVIDGVTGIFVNPHQPEELAGAIEKLIQNPDLRKKMGIEGRKRVLTTFDDKTHISKLEHIYHSYLKSNKTN